MKKYLLLGAVFLCMQSQVFGFATVMTTLKGGDEISFNSNLDNVKVYLNGRMIGVMDKSFSYKVSRDKKDKVFYFKKDGYRSEQVKLGTKLDNMFWGNFFVFGSTGSSTDSWFTGNSREYTPKQFFIELKKR